MPVHLTFALRAGRLIDITEAASGLACDCRCPGCGAVVVARKGKRRAHHFAHARGAVCANALESALHRLAKEILEKERKIRLPAVGVTGHPEWRLGATSFAYQRVYVEKRLRGLRPDLLVEGGGRPLLVEVAVTHRSGWDKVRQLHRQNLAAVEVDLGRWVREREAGGLPVTREAVRRVLVEGVACKSWLFHPRKNFLEAALRRYADARPVRRRSWRGRSFYQVKPCPRQVRTYQPAFGPAVPFADVFQDCLECPFCLEIDYQKELRGFREVAVRPQTVVCWGKWEGREDDLLGVLDGPG